MKRSRVLIIGLALVTLLPACTRRTDASAELNSLLHASLRHSYHFHYTEKTPKATTVVDGAVQDDLRFQDDVMVDGVPVASEVVRDDVRALRFLNYDRASALLVRKTSGVGAVTSAGGAVQPIAPVTVDLLKQGGWVMDMAGGSLLIEVPVPNRHLGDDPVYDALTVPRYVNGAVQAAGGAGSDRAVRFNPESLDYNPSLDPFPHPDAGKGEERFDILPTQLQPRGSQANQSIQQIQQSLPGISYFRNMSIYLVHGRLQRVVDSVSVKRRLLEPNNDVLARLDDAGYKISSTLSIDAQAKEVLKGIDKYVGKIEQAQPIREREMEIVYSQFDVPLSISVPAETTAGNLGGALARGQVLKQQAS